jgi:hypothetical protein
MTPACEGCKTKKIEVIIDHLNADGITTGVEIKPCWEFKYDGGPLSWERLTYCIKRYHKRGKGVQ